MSNTDSKLFQLTFYWPDSGAAISSAPMDFDQYKKLYPAVMNPDGSMFFAGEQPEGDAPRFIRHHITPYMKSRAVISLQEVVPPKQDPEE